MKTTNLTNKVKACLLGLLAAFAILPAHGQSQFQGTYIGYGYVRLEGAVTQPETPSGIAIAEVAADGSISLQNGDITGAVDDNGVITWDQPNDLFLNAGNIDNAVLHGTGSSVSGAVTTFTRIELKSGGGLNAGDSLDETIKLINPANALSDKIRVVHDGTKFVALGSKGTVSISEDGTTWETRSMGTPHEMRDIAHGNGTWVAVGDANTVLTSTDLVNWVPRASGVGGAQQWPVASVAFFNGRFYIVNIIGAVVRSTDGTGSAWEAPIISGSASSGLGATSMLRVLNGRLYLSGKRLSTPSEVSFTTDGTNFTQCQFVGGGINGFKDFVYGNGKYVLGQGIYYATSTDGITFTRANSPITFGFLGFDGTRFIGRAQGTSSGSNAFSYSTDAVTWTWGASNSITAVLDVANAGGVIVGVGGTRSRRSTDGLLWEDITTGAIAPDFAHTGFGARAVYGNGIYLVSGVGGKNYLTRDGVSWTEAPAKTAVFGNGVFVARNEISVDGVNWTPTDMGLLPSETMFNSVVAIAFNGQSFLAATDGSRALVSTDGQVWTHANPDSPLHGTSRGTLFGANGEWVRFGSNGFHSRSLDGGVTWTNHTLGSWPHVGIAYGNGRFVIAAERGQIYAGDSLAAMSAVGPSFPSAYRLDNVAFVDGLFLVRETTTRQYYVSDGLPGSPWVPKSHAHFRAFESVAEGPDFTLLTGADSYVFRVDRVSVGHPVITAQPVALTTLAQNATFQLSASAIGNGPLTYRWYRNGLPMNNDGRVSGADTANLTVSGISESDAGMYSLVVLNAQGSAVSAAAMLGIALQPQILSQPQGVSAPPQTEVSFTVVVDGLGLSYEWFFNGDPIPGAEEETYVIPEVGLPHIGGYHVVVTNPAGFVTSHTAGLSLTAPLPKLALDAGWPVQPIPFAGNPAITALAVQPDGKILIGGEFTINNPAGGTLVNVARLNSDGSIDEGFAAPAPSATPQVFHVLSDGKILMGGTFTSVGGTITRGLVRLHEDGSRDTSYAIPIGLQDTSFVYDLLPRPDGKILVGGSFNQLGGVSRNRIGLLDATGVPDTSFIPAGPNNTIHTLAFQSNGSIIIGGTFNTPSSRLMRMTSGGINDNTFSVPQGFGTSSPQVLRVLVTADDTIYAGGRFISYNNQSRIGIVRINANGSINTGFDMNLPNQPSSNVNDISQAFGNLLVGGGFLSVAGNTGIRYLAMVNGSGATTDGLTMSQSPNGQVNRIRAASGSGQLVAGFFTQFDGQAKPGIARLAPSNAGGISLAIIRQSENTTAAEGDTVRFFAAATGFGSLGFQWFKGGAPIIGATGPELLLANLTDENAGVYRVEVTDASGKIPSADIVLTVGASPGNSFADWPELLDLPADQRGPNARPANDGVDNLVKFALGIHPLESADHRLPSEIVEGKDEDEGFPVVSYIRLKGLAGLTIEVQICVDLEFETDLGSTLLDIEDLGDGTERVTVRSNAPFSAQTTQFFRLMVMED